MAIARKEVAHISRDFFTLAMALVLPVLVVTVFGVAIEFNLKSIPTAVLDSDKSETSRAVIDTFGSSDYFRTFQVMSPSQGLRAIEGERARAFVVIPPQLEKNIVSGRNAQIQVIIDGADNSAASSIMGYLGDIQRRASAKALNPTAPWLASHEPVKVVTRFQFNPELNSKWFIVPGLIVVIMSLLALLLTALTVAREWESGSMELLLSTPVEPLEVILGKIAPYSVLCMIAVTIVYFMARLLFDVPFAGNHLIFILGCLIFLVTYLAQGLLISVLTRKQTIAMQFAMLSGLLPSQLLSGFIFPIESMPKFFQYLTMILPARWFMVIARDSFLQGSSIWDLRGPFAAMTLIAAVFITLAVRRFKKDVEP
jgi:ABC-2 type transport system permease protein